MDELERRLARLEHRVNVYRNLFLCAVFVLIAGITVAATNGIAPLMSKSLYAKAAYKSASISAEISAYERALPASAKPLPPRAGKILAQTQDVVRTRALQIVNNSGQAVIEMAPSTDGEGLIFVRAGNGNTLAYIGAAASNGNGMILVNTKEEKNLIALSSDRDTEDGYMRIRNTKEEALISLNTNQTHGWLRVNKTGGENLVYLGGSTTSNGLFTLSNSTGKSMITMATDEVSGDMWIYNSNDKNIVRLGADIEGQGFLNVNSKTGTELIYAGSNTHDDGLFRVANRFGVLEFFVIGEENHGIVATQDAQERLLTYTGATSSGNGVMRTLSPEGITTWSSSSAQTSTSSTIKGDMDNDGDIDGDDFLLFSEKFGKR